VCQGLSHDRAVEARCIGQQPQRHGEAHVLLELTNPPGRLGELGSQRRLAVSGERDVRQPAEPGQRRVEGRAAPEAPGANPYEQRVQLPDKAADLYA
jgi:hypothetical protein